MNIKDIKLGDRFEYEGITVEAAINPEVLLLGEIKCPFCELSISKKQYNCVEFIDFITNRLRIDQSNTCGNIPYFFKRVDDDESRR